MKIFPLQTLFFHAPPRTFIFEHLCVNYFFPIFFNHVLTLKGGSLFAAVNHQFLPTDESEVAGLDSRKQSSLHAHYRVNDTTDQYYLCLHLIYFQDVHFLQGHLK